MSRKFRFLGYGHFQPFPKSFARLYTFYVDNFYWYTVGEWTEGEVYEMVGDVEYYEDGTPPSASFVDDTGIVCQQELRFFEEVK